MMDDLGDDDAGETSAVRSKIHQGSRRIKRLLPTKHVVTIRIVIGAALVLEGTGRSDAHKRRHEEQNSLPVASMDYGFFTDGDDGEHTRGVTPFLVVKVKPRMMIWSMPVQC